MTIQRLFIEYYFFDTSTVAYFVGHVRISQRAIRHYINPRFFIVAEGWDSNPQHGVTASLAYETNMLPLHYPAIFNK